jgi:hypothetical protein
MRLVSFSTAGALGVMLVAIGCGQEAAVPLDLGPIGQTTGAILADKSTREFLPPPDGLLDTSCGYEILVTFPVAKEYIRTFVDQDGNVVRMIITGNLVVTFTNTATGKSLTVNISGPTHISLVRGTFTSTSEGRTGGPVDGLPGLNIFSGRVDNVNGTLHGHFGGSVCEMLAP